MALRLPLSSHGFCKRFANICVLSSNLQRNDRKNFMLTRENIFRAAGRITKNASLRPFSTTCMKCTLKEIGHEYEKGRLIYIGELGSRLKVAQGAIYVVGATMLAVTPLLLQQVEDSAILKNALLIYLLLFGAGNPAMFYKCASRYVHELYHDEQTDMYTAYLTSPFVAGFKKVTFTPRDCKMPPRMTMFTSFLVKGSPVFINSDAMPYGLYSKMLRHASEFDYENPDRQAQYRDAVKESINRISKKGGTDIKS